MAEGMDTAKKRAEELGSITPFVGGLNKIISVKCPGVSGHVVSALKGWLVSSLLLALLIIIPYLVQIRAGNWI